MQALSKIDQGPGICVGGLNLEWDTGVDTERVQMERMSAFETDFL